MYGISNLKIKTMVFLIKYFSYAQRNLAPQGELRGHHIELLTLK